MDAIPTPAMIEDRAKAAGLSISQVCRKAGVSGSTFWRWKKGKTAPTLTVWIRLLEATDTPASEIAPPEAA